MKQGWIKAYIRCAVGTGVILPLFAIGTAHAAAFANNDFSASGVGTANANVAGITDVSAASYNPAAAAWQQGFQLQGDIINRFRNTSVRQSIGVVPDFGGAPDARSGHLLWMPHDSNFGLTAALTTPFLQNSQWSSALPGLSSFSLKARRLSVDLIYAVSSTLAVSHGVDWYWFKGNMSRGAANFAGEDKASFGVHIGVNWKPAPFWRIGMLLRTGTRARLKGNANSVLAIDTPDEFKLGVSHDIADAVRLELDADWTRWSTMKLLDVVTAGVVTQGHLIDLSDTVAIKSSATWFWRPDTTFRFGYAYENAANSTAKFQPIIADLPGHRVSLGAGGKVFDIHMDLAYAYTFHSKKQVGGVFAGEYRDREQSFALSLSYTF